MKKYCKWLALFFLAWGLLSASPSAVLAATEIFEGKGEYIMEDDETVNEAQETAFNEAMRSIAQQAAVYVRASSQTQDAELSQDEVEMLANALINVQDKRFEKIVLPDGKLQIVAHVLAELDEAATDKALQERLEALQEQRKYDQIAAQRESQQRANEQAKQEYDEALRKTAPALLSEGDKRRDEGDLTGAVDSFNELIEAYPEYAKAYARRGEVYLLQKKYDQARQDFDSALSLDAQEADAFFGRAQFWERKGEKKKALADYRSFMEYANIVEHGDKMQRAVERMVKLEE